MFNASPRAGPKLLIQEATVEKDVVISKPDNNKRKDKNSIAIKIAKRILFSFIIIILVMVLMFFMLGIF